MPTQESIQGKFTAELDRLPISIEEAQIADINSIIALHQKVSARTYRDITKLTDEEVQLYLTKPESQDDWQKYFKKRISDHPDAAVFIARLGEGLKGYSCVERDAEGRYTISGLYVADQGRGIGTALLRTGLKKIGPHDTVLNVTRDTEAVRFYEGHGFKPTGHTWDATFAGKPLPQIEMKLTYNK